MSCALGLSAASDVRLPLANTDLGLEASRCSAAGGWHVIAPLNKQHAVTAGS